MRASRFTRPETATPIMLQERDMEILKVIYKYRFLATGHIGRMFFGCATRANMRLRKLWENGYLQRHYLRPLLYHGSSEVIYSLGENGVDIVAEIYGIDRNIVAQNRTRNGILKPLFIGHLLDVNDFFLNFTQLVDSRPELRLERWLDEYDAQDEYISHLNGRAITKRFRPDGYGRYWYRDKLYSFFLELDRATESTTRFEDKLVSYIEYMGSGRYEKKFGVRYFRVLIVTTTSKRMHNLKQVADNTGRDIFWLTTIDKIRQRKMFDAIWMKSRNDGIFSLLPNERRDVK